jgi:hypothetical protein
VHSDRSPRAPSGQRPNGRATWANPAIRSGVRVEEHPESECTVVAFAGLGGKMNGIPQYEFFRALGDLPARRVMVRDPQRRFYHSPIRGLGWTIPAAARTIAELTAGKPLLFVGSSAGGYAALLFGALVDADAVIAFGPTSTVDVDQRLALGDRRNLPAIESVNVGGRVQSEYFDLVPVLSRRRPHSSMDVFVSRSNGIDKGHAARLSATGAVRIRHCEGSRHAVAQVLRAEGRLASVLREGMATAIERHAARAVASAANSD